MEAELRKTGVSFLGDVSWGMHVCHFYQIKKDLVDILVPYFKAGLENNEFCMWITSQPLEAEEAKAALKKQVENLDEYIEKNQLMILDYSQWYTKSKDLDLDKALLSWVEKEKEALERGFDGLRVAGNASWLEWKNWKEVLNYERMVNIRIIEHRMLAICSYPRDMYNASDIIEISSRHRGTLIKVSDTWVNLGADF